MKKLLARLAGAVTAFNVGRSVGARVDKAGLREGLRWSEELRGDLGKAIGKEDRWAFAAGVATFGWALLTKKEMILVFLAGLLIGWRAWDKLLEALRTPALPSANGHATVDTTATVS